MPPAKTFAETLAEAFSKIAAKSRAKTPEVEVNFSLHRDILFQSNSVDLMILQCYNYSDYRLSSVFSL